MGDRDGRAEEARDTQLNNQIGDAGVTALAEAAEARWRSSSDSSSHNNTISRQAQDALTAACPTVMCASEAEIAPEGASHSYGFPFGRVKDAVAAQSH